MIFVTVGTQLPFDRLVRAVDSWARKHVHSAVLAQIGKSEYKPTHIRWVRTMRPDEFRDAVRQAELVVAHAGIGTLLTALEYGKQAVIVPRMAKLGEQRNDHQLATAHKLDKRGLVTVAYDDQSLHQLLSSLSAARAANHCTHISSDDSLVRYIRQCIEHKIGSVKGKVDPAK